MALKNKNLNNTVILGDVRQVSNELPKKLVQTIITSPPYFGHRKYSLNDENEIGKESNPLDYISNLVKTFDQLKENLKDDGTLWLNLGDTYRNKSLMGIPWRVALAL